MNNTIAVDDSRMPDQNHPAFARSLLAEQTQSLPGSGSRQTQDTESGLFQKPPSGPFAP
jgi:hypothetical protein